MHAPVLSVAGFLLLVTSRVTSALQSPPKCTVAGRTFDGLTYLQGAYLMPGSIYAVCEDGVPKCYVDDGILDKRTRPTVNCSTIPARAGGRDLGMFVDGPELWPEKVVCYRFDTSFPQPHQFRFLWAFRKYQTTVGVKFVHIDRCQAQFGRTKPQVCDGCRQAVTIKGDEDGCWANVGFQPAPEIRVLNVGPDCHYNEVYLHELGHVLGLLHDHQHPKREIVILRDLIATHPHNYIKIKNANTTAYDIKSIMHYDGSEMCLPKKPKGALKMRFCDIHEKFKLHKTWCTVPTEAHCDRSRQHEIGGAKDLSPHDIANLKSMYGIRQ